MKKDLNDNIVDVLEDMDISRFTVKDFLIYLCFMFIVFVDLAVFVLWLGIIFLTGN